jgi:hypothetical protein
MKSYTVYTLVGMMLLGWMAGLGLAQAPEAKPQETPAVEAKAQPQPQPPVTTTVRRQCTPSNTNARPSVRQKPTLRRSDPV